LSLSTQKALAVIEKEKKESDIPENLRAGKQSESSNSLVKALA
jgi:hypothetical protein